MLMKIYVTDNSFWQTITNNEIKINTAPELASSKFSSVIILLW